MKRKDHEQQTQDCGVRVDAQQGDDLVAARGRGVRSCHARGSGGEKGGGHSAAKRRGWRYERSPSDHSHVR